MTYARSTVCPVCGQVDTVRKVSYLVTEGTSASVQWGVAPSLGGRDFYLIGMGGSTISNLAQRLAPPIRRPGGIGLRVFLAATVLALGSMMACGLSLFVVTPEFGRFACGNWVLGISLAAILLIVLLVSDISKIRGRQAVYDGMMVEASSRWNRLYYCARDDITFNPEQNVVVPVHDLRSYLYTQGGG